MKIKYTHNALWMICLAAVLLLPLSGCALLGGFLQNPDYIYEDGAVLVGGDRKPIRLVDNPEAVNVSYAEVLAFLQGDATDRLAYISPDSTSGLAPFVCSDFAEVVHNNAEGSGIRAGYVGIDWAEGGIGHAANVFETLDMGIVYIDCTGSSVYAELEGGENAAVADSWDKVAYIEIGKKYGVIGLEYAALPFYAFFEDYDRKWQQFRKDLVAYNEDVRQYNQEVAGKVFREGSGELARVEAWKARLIQEERKLQSLEEELGDFRFKPLGIVKQISVHW